MNGHVVLGSNFDELYAAILSPKGSEHMAGMTELLCALRQLNVKSKDIVSNRIKAAYESPPFRLSVLSHYEQVLLSKAVNESKHKTRAPPKHKRRSTSPFKIEVPLEAKLVTRSTIMYYTPRVGLSNKSKNKQTGKGLKFIRILYVY